MLPEVQSGEGLGTTENVLGHTREQRYVSASHFANRYAAWVLCLVESRRLLIPSMSVKFPFTTIAHVLAFIEAAAD